MLSAPMAQRLEVVHVGFFQKVTKLKSNRLRYRSWRKASANKVIQGAETQPLQTYLYIIQAILVEWGALRPIFDVYARETGYDRGEKIRVPWWIQEGA